MTVDNVTLAPPLPVARIGGGAEQFGVPGAIFNSMGTSALNANEVRYVPFAVPVQVQVGARQFEVTAGPAGAAHLRIGVYGADTDWQPSGAPLYDEQVAVGSGFTGVSTAAGLSLVLPPGVYLVALNCDTAMTVRTFVSPSPIVLAAMGATPFAQRLSVAQTYPGSFPSPGLKWTALSASAGGLQHAVAFQWQ